MEPSRESLVDTVNANCQVQSAIYSQVWQDANFVAHNNGQTDCDVIGDLQCLMTKMPICMQNAGKDIFMKNPEFAWSFVGVMSTSLIVGYAAYKYIECTYVVVEVKDYVKSLFVEVDRFIKEATETLDDVFRHLSGETSETPDIGFAPNLEYLMVQKMRYAELKLEAAEKLLIRGKDKIEKTVESYKYNRKLALTVTGAGLVVLTGLGGVVATMFPPAALLALAGTAVRVGLGSAAAVGTISVTMWVTMFIKSLTGLEKMEGALLSSWSHYDLADIKHSLVSKRVDELNSMIIQLSKEDGRVGSMEIVKSFASRFTA